MKHIFTILLCLCASSAFAAALHFGEYSVDATTVKHTTPSLNIINEFGERFYVAAYDTMPAPKNVFHVKTVDKEYYLGPWCDAGYYASRETNKCVPCGYGHFCTGGNHRETCTYGIIACNTTTNSFDPPMPAGTENMYNRALTMAEVNQYVPVTDISDWGKEPSAAYDGSIPCNTSVNDPVFEPRDKEIGRGTYLVMHRHYTNAFTRNGAISGTYGRVESAYIVVFDHSVIYRPISMCNNIGNYFDTLHIPYVAYDLRLPDGEGYPYASVNENITNINNIQQARNTDANLYELK